MAEGTGRGEPPDERAIRQQIEALLHQLLGLSLNREARAEQVERLLREHQAETAREVEALVQRLESRLKSRLRLAPPAEAESGRQFVRFDLNLRLQHIVLFASCIVLIITGLPLKFHDTALGALLFALMGGIENSSLIHRIGAAALIAVGLFHLGYTILVAAGRRFFVALIPTPKDARDLRQMLRYFLGRTDEQPRFGRFSYVEKFDYWAVYWGMVIMVGSGWLLWFENQTLRVLPKYMIDIAKEAHSDEALLATLAIIIWHFYNAHFNPRKFPMNKVWLTGRLSEEEMRHEHPLEYEEILRREEKQGEAR
jgi:cytochrome b subunit of formate dehydrogenase